MKDFIYVIKKDLQVQIKIRDMLNITDYPKTINQK